MASRESAFIAALRGIAGDPAARGLLDDAAVLEVGGARLVLTHDMLVEGVHFLPADPPADVAWKLVAVNLSDLAAKGARPIGLLLGFTLGDEAWDAAFVEGLRSACAHFAAPLLGGDTVSTPLGSPRSLGLTAIGTASDNVLSRAGARPGDRLWVSGTIGDAGLGLRMARSEIASVAEQLDRYRRPQPRLDAGIALAPIVSAMMDVSDGLLIDALRIADASHSAIALDLDRLAPVVAQPAGLGRLLDAATAGDDYELLFTAAPDHDDSIAAIAAALGLPLTPIGTVLEGSGLRLTHQGGAVALPERLGFLHGG